MKHGYQKLCSATLTEWRVAQIILGKLYCPDREEIEVENEVFTKRECKSKRFPYFPDFFIVLHYLQKL